MFYFLSEHIYSDKYARGASTNAFFEYNNCLLFCPLILKTKGRENPDFSEIYFVKQLDT